MLEVLLLIFLGKRIAKMMREKGRSPVGYVFMLVGLWIGGELLGAVVAVVLTAGSDAGFLPYAGALVGAALGAVTAFAIAKALGPVSPPMESAFPVMPASGYAQGATPPGSGYAPPGGYPPGNVYPVQTTYPQQPGQRQ